MVSEPRDRQSSGARKGEHPSSNLVQKGLPCEDCGSSDALAYYDDDHTHCFSCGKTRGGIGRPAQQAQPQGKHSVELSQVLDSGSFKAIKSRGLTQETCRKWDYKVRLNSRKEYEQLAAYRDPHGSLVGVKIRNTGEDGTGKEFAWVGAAHGNLYGRHLWGSGGKMLTILEGEIDTMTVSQVNDHRYPVVGVPNGAAEAAKAIAKNLEWVNTFEKVLIGLDQDGPGREACLEVAAMLPPGKAFIITWPQGSKDPSDLMQQGREAEITKAIWAAKPYRPDGIVDARDLTAQCMEPVVTGIPWPWPFMTSWTYGRRDGEVYTLGAGCVDGETEYLGPTGWVAIKDYAGGPVVQITAQREAELVEPLEYVVGGPVEALEIAPKYGLNMVLTRGHRVIYCPEERDNWHECSAEAAWGHAPSSHEFRGRIPTAFEPTGADIWKLAPAALRLQVAVEADGYMCPRSRGKGSCVVRVKRPRKKAALVKLLRQLHVEFTTSDCHEYTQYRFVPPNPKGWLYHQAFVTAPPWVLRIVAEEAPRWDGDTKHTFRTTVKASADWVQFAMHASGLRAGVSFSDHDGRGSREYRVQGATHHLVSTRHTPVKVVSIAAHYCFRVPSGMLLLRRHGRIFITGNTGIGKTDWIAEVCAATISGKDKAGTEFPPEAIAIFGYEAGPVGTKKMIAGKLAGRRFHIPQDDSGASWTDTELRDAMVLMDETCWNRGGRLYINDSFGAADWEEVQKRARFLAHSEGVKHFIVDPISALVTGVEDERKLLDKIVLEASMLAQELKAKFYLLSHLARPGDGPAHEEGGKVSLKQFRGSNGIGMFSSFVFGLERNQQAEEESERGLTTIRVVKDRYTGNSTGKTSQVIYDPIQGTLDIPYTKFLGDMD